MLRRTALTLAAAAVALPFAATPAAAQTRNVIDTLAADGRFNSFIELVGRAGLTDQLRGVGPFTLFAPTDAALNSAPAGRIADLTGENAGGTNAGTGGVDPVRLRAFVQYYIVPGTLPAAQLAGGTRTLRTLNGRDLTATSNAGVVQLSNPSVAPSTAGFGGGGINVSAPANVVQADIPASNGVVHAISGVLFP